MDKDKVIKVNKATIAELFKEEISKDKTCHFALLLKSKIKLLQIFLQKCMLKAMLFRK